MSALITAFLSFPASGFVASSLFYLVSDALDLDLARVFLVCSLYSLWATMAFMNSDELRYSWLSFL